MITATVYPEGHGFGASQLDLMQWRVLAKAYGFSLFGERIFMASGSDLQQLRTRVEMLVRAMQHKGYTVQRYKVAMLLVDSYEHDEFKLGVEPKEQA